MKNIVLLILLTFNFCAKGQDMDFGDSRVADKIKTKTAWIYNNKDTTYFFLTNEPLQKEITYGTNIIAHSIKDSINRIITFSFTKNGQLSTEWYFSEKEPIFVYQVFEYFNEANDKNDWKNFKRLWGWESRYYFTKGKLEYHKHKGRRDKKRLLESEASIILRDANAILNYVIKQIEKK